MLVPPYRLDPNQLTLPIHPAHSNGPQVNFLSHWLLANQLVAAERQRRTAAAAAARTGGPGARAGSRSRKAVAADVAKSDAGGGQLLAPGSSSSSSSRDGGSGGADGEEQEAREGLRVVMVTSLTHRAGALQWADKQSRARWAVRRGVLGAWVTTCLQGVGHPACLAQLTSRFLLAPSNCHSPAVPAVTAMSPPLHTHTYTPPTQLRAVPELRAEQAGQRHDRRRAAAPPRQVGGVIREMCATMHVCMCPRPTSSSFHALRSTPSAGLATPTRRRRRPTNTTGTAPSPASPTPRRPSTPGTPAPTAAPPTPPCRCTRGWWPHTSPTASSPPAARDGRRAGRCSRRWRRRCAASVTWCVGGRGVAGGAGVWRAQTYGAWAVMAGLGARGRRGLLGARVRARGMGGRVYVRRACVRACTYVTGIAPEQLRLRVCVVHPWNLSCGPDKECRLGRQGDRWVPLPAKLLAPAAGAAAACRRARC